MSGPWDRSYAVVTRNPTRAHVRRTRPRVLENMPDPVLPHAHEQRRSAIAATDGRVESAANGEFRRRLHDVVDHAVLPYGYTLAADSGSAVLATAHGRFGTVQPLLFLLGAGAGFALIALISAGTMSARPMPATRTASIWNVGAAGCALAATSATAHALDGLLAYFATGWLSRPSTSWAQQRERRRRSAGSCAGERGERHYGTGTSIRSIRSTSLSAETITTNRSAAAATIFSQEWVPPPPLMSQPEGATWSAPSIAMSSRGSASRPSKGST